MAVVTKNILKFASWKFSVFRRGVANDSPAHGKDAGVGFGGFSVGDVAQADVDLRKGGPGEEIVWLEGGGLEGCAEGFFEIIGFQKHHGKCVPGIEIVGIELDALAVESGGLFEFTKGEVAAGIVEQGLDGFAQNFRFYISTRKDEWLQRAATH